MKRTLILLMIISCLLTVSVAAASENDTVTLTSDGDLAAALESVPDGGTIYIDGVVTVPKDFAWKNHGKTVTFSGNILSFTRNYDMFLGDNVRFENIKLLFAENANLYANGHSLYIAENVVTIGECTVYGGGKINDVSSTNMTLLGGTYTAVYGGGCAGHVTGDVNLTIGGKFNESMGGISHKHTYSVFGGGYNGEVRGNVNLSFGGHAKANYIYGGASGKSSRIHGCINLDFNGGEAMSICGGSYDTDQQSNVNLRFSGGEVQQIFGGCEKSSMTGDIHVQVLGGKVSRRIYGGCYNNYDGSWEKPAKFVKGNILLTIGFDANIALDYNGNDLSVYAHSRHNSPPDTEIAHVNYTSAATKARSSKLLGAQDGLMRFIMAGTPKCDGEHILSYTVSENVITQKCTFHPDATATIHVENAHYTGTAIEKATVTLSDNWIGPVPVLTYSNNINMGTALVTVTLGDLTTTCNFQILARESENNWVIWVGIGALLLLLGLFGGIYIVNKKKLKL